MNRGRWAEQRIARRLTAWTKGAYQFRRRGLGHAGLPDLVVTATPMVTTARGAWPYPISIKSYPRGAPGLDGLMRMAAFVMPGLAPSAPGWRWWTEIPADQRDRYWLVWRAHATWWLSASADNPVWHAGGWRGFLWLSGPETHVPGRTGLLEHLFEKDVRSVILAAYE